jgi:hypothetical protein
MSDYKARPEHWDIVEFRAQRHGVSSDSCILELSSRLAIAEKRISELQANHPAPPDSSPPAGGLVEMAAWKIAKFASEGRPGDDATPTARAAILACAMWLEERGLPTAAHLLRGEASQ